MDTKTTKFERAQAAAQERDKREGNIAILKKDIIEAEELLRVMPSSTFEERQDAQFVRDRVAWLYELLTDEQRAYNATFEAEGATIDAVVSKLEKN
jgi:hypothetical protein